MPLETEQIAETAQNPAKSSAKHLKAAAERAYSGQKKKGLDDEQIAQYLPMVHKIAQRVTTYLKPPLSYDDLISAGTVGLVKAGRDFDPSHRAEFKTYAYIRIKGAILDELRRWSFTPPNVTKQIRNAVQLSSEIARQTGSTPTNKQLAEKLGITTEELYQTFENARSQHFVSLDGAGENTPPLSNILEAPNSTRPDEHLEKAELIERLAKAIEQLEKRQRQIILLYYQQQLTMKQIAEVFEITEPRVSQLHASALFNLSIKLRQQDGSQK